MRANLGHQFLKGITNGMNKYISGERQNPFSLTKAVDFSDEEIQSLWVEFPTRGGFKAFVKPMSQMPIIILGGKGSGKTHLMRHFSFSGQKQRSPSNIVDGIKSEGYIGIYALCGGLNAQRFSGKGQPLEKWRAIFSYYVDLWLVQILLGTIEGIFSEQPKELRACETKLCDSLIQIFDQKFGIPPTSLCELLPN
jgi:hypothetical protein